jgi:oxygen-independent coproporphyrinogen-3 oxidase
MGGRVVDNSELIAVRAILDDQLRSRQVNKIQHGFPSPRLWRETTIAVGDILTQRRRDRNGARRFHLYVGVPYCIRTRPPKCGYCLFPSEDFAGCTQVDDYLRFLEREGELYRPFLENERPRSVYIGGGTPNLLKGDQCARLLAIIRSVFPKIAEADCITLEGIPPLFSRKKLATMRDLGIRRISMGVQQLNSELSALSGRKQTAEHTLNAITWCRELGLDCNADLIFGWPRQTMDSMLADLERLVASGIDHITHYELNVGGAADFALHRRDELPSPAECRAMYHASREFLLGHGYRQLTAYDFEKTRRGDDRSFVYEECDRDWDLHETWGWGFAGISNFQSTDGATSWTYVNGRRIRDYADRLDRGELPIECGFYREAVDHRLDQLFRHLQGMAVDCLGYRSRFGVDPLDEHRAVWEALRERGLANWSNDRIMLTPDGVYYTPVVQAVLASARNKVLADRTYRLTVRGATAPAEPVVLDRK